MNVNVTVQEVENKSRGNSQRLRSACMHPDEVDAWFSRNQGVYVIGIETCQSNISVTQGLNNAGPLVLVVYIG